MADNKFMPQHVEGNDASPPQARMSAETPGQNLKEKSEALIDAEALDKQAAFIPNPEDQIDALGIPEWRTLEKKLVRRLDMTLLPCLWTLYLFNYLDRASIAQARLNTLEADLNLDEDKDHYQTAVMILSLGYAAHLLAEELNQLTKTSQLRSWSDPFEYDHRLPSAQSLPLLDGYRMVRRVCVYVWYHKLHGPCPCTLLPRCCRSPTSARYGFT
jgi:hypothetical protein